MSTRRVAIITGASRGIGAGLVAGYRRRVWAVVASAQNTQFCAIVGQPDPHMKGAPNGRQAARSP
jgi:NAD(P)-dependent dehydrogenase (short-subunit alcohol dehydrogenase family)